MISVEEARAVSWQSRGHAGRDAAAASGWNRILARPRPVPRHPAAGRCLGHGWLCRPRGGGARGGEPRGHRHRPGRPSLRGAVGPGEAVRIFTGAFVRRAPMPSCCRRTPGADGRVRVNETVRRGRWIRARGSTSPPARIAAGRTPPDRPRHRPGGGRQPCLAGGAPGAAHRHPGDRRRDRPARRPDPAGRHRQQQCPCPGRPGPRRRRRPAGAADRAGRFGCHRPGRRSPPAPATCW